MMSDGMRFKLRNILIEHEGFKTHPYMDTIGKITIGVGYNLSDRGMSENWINKQLDEDIEYFRKCLSNDFDWFDKLSEARQIALIDMCFMGYKAFLSFKKMIDALSKFDYSRAATEMLNSKWAKQVKGRAHQLAEIMVSGKL